MTESRNTHLKISQVEHMTRQYREQSFSSLSSLSSPLSFSSSFSSSLSPISLANSLSSHSIFPYSSMRQIKTVRPSMDERLESGRSCQSSRPPKMDSVDLNKVVQVWPDIDLEEIEADAKLGLSFPKLMLAGSCAGMSEHLVMFPVDTVKTRMQAELKPGVPVYRNPFDAVKTIIREEGFFRLYRGVSATVVSAIPSHGVYFASYEFWKKLFGGDKGGHQPLRNGAAGGLAIMAHDAVVTPLDVVKQRLQLKASPYRGVIDCIRATYAEEGLRAFFASYSTTVTMNVPFMSVQFAAYESLKIFLSTATGTHGPVEQMIGGGLAGALGGFVSTPFDVIKTRLQTQAVEKGHRRLSPKEIGQLLWKEGGIRAFFRGAQARVLYFIPSAAICWTTYETMKKLLLTFSEVRDD